MIVVVEELDDDKLWAKLLVRRIKQVKDEDMREDFKQHVNVITLQAVCGTCQVSPANFPSPLLSKSANMQQMPASANMQQMPASGNMGNMGMPIGSMHTMTQEEWDSRMAFQGMMPSMGMQ